MPSSAVERAPTKKNQTQSLYSDLDHDLEVDDADEEVDAVETSRMNTMFDFSAKLIRRTLKVAGCVLVNIENLMDLENIEADVPTRSTIMGACWLKHLRSAQWHEKVSGKASEGSGSNFKSSIPEGELDSTKVDRKDAFDTSGLDGAWLRQLLIDHPRAVPFDEESLPEPMKTFLPAGLQSCLLSPIYDSNAKAFALIIVFNDDKGVFTKADCHYIEAFGSSIYAEVLNQSLQRADEAKALFISKISHEFRTPLHGVLASAEFLNDMPDTTPAQLGFVQTIDTCGRTLLDIINHVLDYSKLSFSNKVVEIESLPTTTTLEEFDVVQVAEQVLGTAFSSYEFKRINDHIDVQRTNSQQSKSDSDSGSLSAALGRNIEVIIQAPSRTKGYTIYADLGAFRRIILNLLGNALKYTHTGHVILSLEMIADEDISGLERLKIVISDTGVGIASTFLLEMFKPFTQEDNYSAGTGLGLSIVKELVCQLHGSIDVKSTKHVGSKFTISYPVIPRFPQKSLFAINDSQRELQNVKFHCLSSVAQACSVDERATSRVQEGVRTQLVEWYQMVEVSFEDAEILITDDNVYELQKEEIERFGRPILTLCSTTAKYEKARRRNSVMLQSFVTKPCGPLKLGEAVASCLTQATNLARLNLGGTDGSSGLVNSEIVSAQYEGSPNSKFSRPAPPSPAISFSSTIRMADRSTNVTGGSRRTIREEQDEQTLADHFALTRKPSRRSANGSISHASIAPSSPLVPEEIAVEHTHNANSSEVNRMWSEGDGHDDRSTDDTPDSPPTTESTSTAKGKKKHILVVEDNPINMMLLVAFAKRKGLAVTTAANGKIAIDRVRDRALNYDAILMDINMPICNGFVAMAHIRQFEVESQRSRSHIAALTGLSTPEDRLEAKNCGADAFFTKPVKMQALAELMYAWGVLDTPHEHDKACE